MPVCVHAYIYIAIYLYLLAHVYVCTCVCISIYAYVDISNAVCEPTSGYGLPRGLVLEGVVCAVWAVVPAGSLSFETLAAMEAGTQHMGLNSLPISLGGTVYIHTYIHTHIQIYATHIYMYS